jgi:ATP-binding protein involved in chromosome partitioning
MLVVSTVFICTTMATTIQDIRTLLSRVINPDTRKTLAVTDSELQIAAAGDAFDLTVTLGYPVFNGEQPLAAAIRAALDAAGVRLGALNFQSRIAAHAVQRGLRPLDGVRNIIAVASGKGGVGKSTTAVNLALALHAQGARVGLLDADIYGPSVPIMLGLSGKPKSADGKRMEPMIGHGLQANSIGFLMDDDGPAIWRGPMVTQALTQLLSLTNWNDLDYLIVDMTPGNRRYCPHHGPESPVDGVGDRHHAPGSRAGRCPQGPDHVPESGCPGAGDR